LNREQKAAVIDEVAAQISESEAVFAVDYRGISVPQAADLRTRLRDADASFRIVKNTLTERAADKAGADGLKQLLEGPTAMTFVRGDAAMAAKALADFRRTSGLLTFKGGWMNGAPLDAGQIDDISRLPSREVLHGRLVGMVASPLTGLVTSLGGLIGGLARQLQQMADEGMVGGAAPTAESTPDLDTGPTESPEDTGPAPDPAPGETPAEDATPSDTETQEDN
jgi:large subunit ribosomal protein L10